jgi:CubicO group peptidase (beta-lactamase class C family)
MKYFLLIGLGIIPLFSACQAVDTVKLNAVISEAVAKDVFSGNILIANRGDVLYKKSLGTADFKNGVANTAATKFQIGSITKFFTKTLILQLIESHALKKSETIGDHLTGFPSTLAVITIQQLLDHTSGLSSYYDVPGYDSARGKIQSISDVLEFVMKEELQFQPGNRAAYSNSGYAVLAGIIEKVTGESYGQVLSENIFKKLGMNSTGYTMVNKSEPGKAKGYLTNQPGRKKDNSTFKITGAVDGGVFSTTDDMLRFIRSITMDNILLRNESKLDLFSSPLFPVDYKSWADFEQRGRLSIGGGAPGLSAVLSLNMATGNQIIVLSNYDEGSADEVFIRISALLNGQQLRPFEVPPARFIYSLVADKGGKYFSAHYAEEFKRAGIQLGDDDMPFLFAGMALTNEKKYSDARSLYQVYTKEYPQIVVAWNELGDIYKRQGKKSEAKKCYQQALKIRPNERAQQALEKLK